MRRTLLALCIALGSGTTLGSEIERVEPPFWWQGFQETELQLMIYGDGIGATEPAVDHPGVTIARVERVDSPNYLVVYLDIGTAERLTAARDDDLAAESPTRRSLPRRPAAARHRFARDRPPRGRKWRSLGDV